MMNYSYNFFMFFDKKVYLIKVYMHVLDTTLRVEHKKCFKVTHEE